MTKKLVYFFLLLTVLIFPGCANDKKEIVAVDAVAVADVRISNCDELEFTALAANIKADEVGVIYSANPDTTLDMLTVKNKCKVSSKDSFSFTIKGLKIKEYYDPVFFRAFYVKEGIVTYGNTLYETSPLQICLNHLQDETINSSEEEVFKRCQRLYKIVEKNNFGDVYVSSDFIEKDLDELFDLFAMDWFDKYQETIDKDCWRKESFQNKIVDFLLATKWKNIISYLEEKENGEEYAKKVCDLFKTEDKEEILALARKLRIYVNVKDKEIKKTGDKIKLPATNLVKEGYRWLGFTAGKRRYLPGEVCIITSGDVIFEALYARETYNITYHLFLGENSPDNPAYYTEDDCVTFKPGFKKGYKFLGWFGDKEFKNRIDGIAKGSKGDIDLYASFAISAYDIKYNACGMEVVNLNPLSYDISSEIELKPCEKEGFVFTGWFLAGDINAWTRIPQGTTGDLEFTAKFATEEEISSAISLTKESIDNYFAGLGEIGNNIDFAKIKKEEGADITWESSNPSVLDSSGVLRRQYDKTKLIYKATISFGIICETSDYELAIQGYKPLKNIAAGYVYSNYQGVSEELFKTLDIIYLSFVYGSKSGSIGGFDVCRNARKYILPKAREYGCYVIPSIGPESAWTSFANPKNDLTEKFACEAARLICENGFDGIDIDWEHPGKGQEKWFTGLAKEIYRKVKENNPHHLVTAAIAGGKWQPPYYDLKNSQNYLDYINLMCYGMVSRDGAYQNALYPRNKESDVAILMTAVPSPSRWKSTAGVMM